MVTLFCILDRTQMLTKQCHFHIGDTAIFSLYNGDRTNIMSLESPSTKLKYEFINRISISIMGHEGK
jgi:hypothetical protein